VVDGQVGSGVYGTVFKAHDPNTNEQLALKMIKMSKEKDGQSALSENLPLC
jgi:serine/threonine protein kinase